MKRFATLFFLHAIALVVSACSRDAAGVRQQNKNRLEQFVVGSAAEALGTDGRFVLAAHESGPYPEIDARRAVVLAQAYVSEFALLAKGQWELDRGEPINVRQLRACNRVLLAESSFDPPASSVSLFARKMVGPYWLTTMCDATGSPNVLVAVSTYNVDVSIDQHGFLVQPSSGGANFMSIGIPSNTEVPISPESAVSVAAISSGKRVALAPRLIREGGFKAPWLAIWTIGLEAPVATVGSETGRKSLETNYFVGYSNSWSPAFLKGKNVDATVRTEEIPDQELPANGASRQKFRVTYQATTFPNFERGLLEGR